MTGGQGNAIARNVRAVFRSNSANDAVRLHTYTVSIYASSRNVGNILRSYAHIRLLAGKTNTKIIEEETSIIPCAFPRGLVLARVFQLYVVFALDSKKARSCMVHRSVKST